MTPEELIRQFKLANPTEKYYIITQTELDTLKEAMLMLVENPLLRDTKLVDDLVNDYCKPIEAREL